jgi:hypothetical protein
LSDLNQETNTPQAETNISAYVWFAVFSAPELFTILGGKLFIGPGPELYAAVFVLFWLYSSYTAFKAMKKAGSIQFKPKSIVWLIAILFVVALAMLFCLRADVSWLAYMVFVLLALLRSFLSAVFFNSMTKDEVFQK